MMIGLPRVPEPPHDPRSLLLNGRLGFRPIAPAPGQLATEIDPDRCSLVLPPAAAAARELAEASGSLGGLRPPSNVALGPDGSIYLLDRTDAHLKRFDPCTCRFERVPCLGGAGSGAREFCNPGGIAIACGNVYICDTDNHRVSVLTLRGFAIRGFLTPPRSKQPWKPTSIAVDSLGRAWVGDALGRLHRFSPTGLWEQSWPMVPVARHLAIDNQGRLYVIAKAAEVPAVRVLDLNARPIADAPQKPEQARHAFAALPFTVDEKGRLWLEPVCDPRAVHKVDRGSKLIFDADGNPLEFRPDATAALYEKAAVFRSDALDSRIAQCVWHRIALFGALPPGTQIRARVFCADQKFTPEELDALASWSECAIATQFDESSSWDCLVRAQPGRYLWIELAFEGNGTRTPSIGAIVVEFPRISLRRFLPAVFGMEPISADFTDRFLAIFDTSLRSIEGQVDRAARMFDPASSPATTRVPGQLDFLAWLGSWIGISLDRNWDIATRRRFLKHAGALFDRRGTLRGLREQLLLLLGFDRRVPCAAEPTANGRCAPAPRNCGPEPRTPRYTPPPLVLEHFHLRRWLRVGAGRLGAEAVVWGERIVGRTRLGAHGQLGVTQLNATPDPLHDPFLVHANQFSVFVPAWCQSSERSRKALENLLRNEAPAGARGTLHFVEPRFRIGIQSMLGFDTVVAALPQEIRLGETPIGAASVLTAPPHRQGGPGVVLGRDGRGGTSTLLS
jgi:phage tail-like protein